jgi:hypothetical protein
MSHNGSVTQDRDTRAATRVTMLDAAGLLTRRHAPGRSSVAGALSTDSIRTPASRGAIRCSGCSWLLVFIAATGRGDRRRERGPQESSAATPVSRDIALQFGHQDGGELVRKLYGHPDAALARERVREAFRQAPAAPIPLVAAGR